MAEETAAETQKHLLILKNAVENTNEAFVTIDESSTVIFFNKAAERMFGYDRAEVLGQNLMKILTPMCRAGHELAVARYVRTGEATLIGHETELTVASKNGETFPASISFSVADIEGQLYFTGLVRDLSDTRNLEDRLAQNERLAALGQTVAEINHEIKNPLIMIGGFARQLLKKATEEKDRAKLTIIVDEVTRLEHLLAGLKELYKPPQLNLVGISLNELLEEVVDLAHSYSGGKGIDIHFAPGTDVVVEVDREKMKQVLLNLVKNGIEATPSGGKVVVSTRVQEHLVEVDVTDTGEGIPEEIKKRIFLPFFTTKEQGTGLGLCISKRIIEDHPGCSFHLDSEEGKGTVATIGLRRSKL
ncbi:MAG: PAS domain S-box protein [Deltaproteobacteria bacterium]|nr:PAS domain S-box protein [Deltaproteobacteria bacterium]